MSEVKLLYDSEDIFSNIGPTPFISRDVQNVYSSSEINLIDNLSLTGRIKRNYPISVTGPTGATGATGSSYNPCESGFQGIKNIADSLISKFSKNFKKLQLTEKIGNGATKIIEEWENCIVQSISFDDNKWYDWVPYTISIECYKKGYFENYGIIEPRRSLQLDVSPDNTINIRLTTSCRGLNKTQSGFQNAKNFVASNSNLLNSDLRNFYLSYPSYSVIANLFTFESQFDNGTYWLTSNNIIIAPNDAIAPDGTQTADSLVVSSNALNTITGQSTNSFLTGLKKYKASIYVKSGTGQWVTLTVGGTYTAKTWFNISTGEKGSKEVQNSKAIDIIYYDIESFDNGWYKISMAFESFGDYSLFFTLSQVDSNGTSTYASRSGKSISIWKASIEYLFDIYDLNSYNSFLVSQEESLNRLTGEVSLSKSFILQSKSFKSNYGILKYTRDMSIADNGDVSVKVNGTHQGPLLARGLTGISSRDSTLEAVKYDISNKDWYSIANEIYIKNLTEYSYPNLSTRISQRVAGKTGTIDEIRIWSTFNTSTQSFVKNPSCWIFGIDISGLIVGCNEPGYESKKVGMMISPKHYLCLWNFKVPIGTTLYFLTNDNKVLTRTVSNFIEVTGLESIASDIALCLLNEELPNTVKFLKILSKDYNIFGNSLVGSYIFIRDQRDPIDDATGNYQKANIKMITSIPEAGTIEYGNPPSNPELYFINVEPGANHDSSNNICLITPNDEMIALGLNITGGSFIHLSPFINNINIAMAELGGEYSVTEYYPEDFSPLYRTPTNFSLQRDFSNNSVGFSLEFSNKQDNKVYIIDETRITHDLISSRKCIEANLTIRSEIKCKKERWDNVLKYYNQLDFVDYVQKKWTKFGNTERLNFNDKDNSYSENQFEGSIQIGAKFCNSLGFDCGCLQNLTYEYSFVPALKEIKASLPINSNGCHFIENMKTIKRASFNIKGSLIKPVCCSYEKTVAQLRNRVNQIANSIFYGDNKILDSSQISKVSPAGSISFDFSWSAEKAIIIPDNLL
jgi:hypothetical protein